MAQPDLIKAAQERGINISQADDDTWHGSYIHDGQEYTLDSDTLEGLSDDMHALADIMQQDDTYQVDYNEDLDRYVVEVEGFEEPFSDQVLAKAFQNAKAAYMQKMRQQEADRKSRETKPRLSKKASGNGGGEPETVPAPPPPVDQEFEQAAPQMQRGAMSAQQPQPTQQPAALGGLDLPDAVTQAITRMLDAITEKLRGPQPTQLPAGQPSGFQLAPEHQADITRGPTPPAPPKPKAKRGLSKT